MRIREIWEYITETPGNTNFTIFKQMVESYVARKDNELYDYDLVVDKEADLFGKTADDIQEGVWFEDGKAYGKLKYVDDYTGFSGKPEEQIGFFFTFKVDFEGADTIKVNGVTLDPSDNVMILIMQDANGNRNRSGKVKLEITKDEETIVDYIDVSALQYGD